MLKGTLGQLTSTKTFRLKTLLTIQLYFLVSLNLGDGYQTASQKCNFNGSRESTGLPGITVSACESQKNCFDSETDILEQRCFKPQRTERPDCDYNFPSLRIPGGWYGISKRDCESRGSCFDNSLPDFEWCFRAKGPYRVILQSPRVTNWGTWGPWNFCPSGTFVTSVDLKVQKPQGGIGLTKDGDDSALNGIKFYCQEFKRNGAVLQWMTSTESPWGEWTGIKHCHAPAFGFQLRSTSEQGCWDDTAATDFKLICPSGDELISGNLKWGAWTDKQHCPSGMAICGIRTQVEYWQLWHKFPQICLGGDDTALNNVDVACCELPNPAKMCNATYRWVTVASCNVGLNCKVSVTTDIKVQIETGSWTSEEYIQMGFALDSALMILQVNFEQKYGNKGINAQLLSQIFQKITLDKTVVVIELLNCATAIEILELRCGIYTVSTAEFRCQPSVPDRWKLRAHHYFRTGSNSSGWDKLFQFTTM